jgi:septal ring factor EnvC (AmiA/AmiB activator)
MEDISSRNCCFHSGSFSDLAPRCIFRKSSFVILFFLVLNNHFAFSAVDPNYVTHLNDLEGEVQNGIQSTQENMNNLLVKVNRVEQAPQAAPERIVTTEDTALRKRLAVFLGAAVKMQAKHLEYLKKQKNYLNEDSQISKNILPHSDLKARATASVGAPFQCHYFPIKNDDHLNFEKVFSFGQAINPSLGKSSAKTQGIWWGNTFGSLIRTCSAGEVVMSEYIEGRGHVVGIRHNSQDITLYGNLDSSSLKTLKPGMKIPEGAPLGFALERFYFEARRGSDAIDPELIMSNVGQDSDAQSGLE